MQCGRQVGSGVKSVMVMLGRSKEGVRWIGS